MWIVFTFSEQSLPGGASTGLFGTSVQDHSGGGGELDIKEAIVSTADKLPFDFPFLHDIQLVATFL
jgi:hypothetical protein